MRKTLMPALLLASAAGLAGCGESPSGTATDVPRNEGGADKTQTAVTVAAPAPQLAGIQVVYSEQEPGVDPFRLKFTVTPGHLRIDDRPDGASFVLFDRGEGTIYSVSEENTAILVLSPRPVTTEIATDRYRLKERRMDYPDAPTIGGKQPVRYQYVLEGRVCMDVVVVEGMLGEAVEALREYRQTLSMEHLRALKGIPIELQDPCDLAVNVFEPVRHLEHGLPILETDYIGRTRELLDFAEDVALNAGLLELPQDYGRLTLDELAAPPLPEAGQ